MSEKKITPVMKQYLNIKEQHPDKYVLFRMGDFYELFYDDAVTAAKILQITLTKRGGTPMCGIPFHQLDNYLYKITTAGKKAAIVEQMEDPSKTKGLVKRDVVRIVTPGTINDNKVLDTKSNNYLLSLNYKEKQGIFFLVVAAMDISTGEAEIVKKKCPDLKGEIDNFINIYTPREIIIPEYLNEPSVLNTVFYKTDNFIINPLPDYIYKKEYCTLKIKNHFHLQSLKGISLENDPLAAGTFYALLHYGRETQKNKLNYLKIPRIINSDSYMLLDSATQKNLEILRNLQDNSSQNTLVSVMDRTVTAMGGRLLKRILLKPLLQKKKIMERQELVDFFFRNYEHRKKVHGLLKEINDFERLCSKLALGRILPKEMISLKNSLQNALELNSYLQKINLTSLVYRQTDALRNITANISATMLAEPSNTVTEGGMIQPAADTKLTQYHKILSEGKQWLAALQKDESTKTGINNLKIKYNDNIGYFLEVSKANVKLVPDYFIKKQTLVNCDRFTTEKLASYQDKLLEAEDNVNNLEYEIFNRVKTECAAHINKIQGLSEKCAYTDVMTSFSNTAAAQKYIRPEIRNDHLINIENGRHPVIENNIDSNFVPNSLKIGTADNLVHVITGPNMS
ncbi:MAG TPA: DNA mismatch repair protein MutS, partial [Spirochaetota bacterium]|nr:DNA mismatch repair protein MutS [Spirochaetota bacterium]